MSGTGVDEVDKVRASRAEAFAAVPCLSSAATSSPPLEAPSLPACPRSAESPFFMPHLPSPNFREFLVSLNLRARASEGSSAGATRCCTPRPLYHDPRAPPTRAHFSASLTPAAAHLFSLSLSLCVCVWSGVVRSTCSASMRLRRSSARAPTPSSSRPSTRRPSRWWRSRRSSTPSRTRPTPSAPSARSCT